MLKRKVGALIITILLFVLVVSIPYWLGSVALPEDEPETTMDFVQLWLCGVILIAVIALFTCGAVTSFHSVYKAILDFLSNP